jgi:hypothetical protein
MPLMKPEELELAPPMLPDMRYVWFNPEPEDPEKLDEWDKKLVDIRALRKEKPFEFIDRLTRLETELRRALDRKADLEREQAKQTARSAPVAPEPQALTTVLSEWNGKGPCPTCKREPLDPETVAARERGMKWLKEHGGE